MQSSMFTCCENSHYFDPFLLCFDFYYYFVIFYRKCGSPKRQIGRVLTVAVPSTSVEPSNQLVVPSRSYAFEVTGDIICPGFVQGIDHLRDPRLNKVCHQMDFACFVCHFNKIKLVSNWINGNAKGLGLHIGRTSSARHSWTATSPIQVTRGTNWIVQNIDKSIPRRS